MGHPLPSMPLAPPAERAAEAKDLGTGGIMFAELEAVYVSNPEREAPGVWS